MLVIKYEKYNIYIIYLFLKQKFNKNLNNI